MEALDGSQGVGVQFLKVIFMQKPCNPRRKLSANIFLGFEAFTTLHDRFSKKTKQNSQTKIQLQVPTKLIIHARAKTKMISMQIWYNKLKTIPATKRLSATTNEACCNFGFQACGNFIMQTDLSNQKLLMTSDTKFSIMYRTFQSSYRLNQTFETKPKLQPSKEKTRLSRMLLQQDQELWAHCCRFYVQVSATRMNAGCIFIFNHGIQELTQTLN